MSDGFLYTSDGKPYDVAEESLFVPEKQGPIHNTTLIIPGAVCKRWMETGGKICPFCAFPPLALSITGGKTFATSTFWEMCQGAFQVATDRLTIFNGGSFFPPEEIPAELQHRVYKKYADTDQIKLLAVETRPEYFTHEVAENIRGRIGEKDFMIMIGLESMSSVVRNKHLKKGMREDVFLQALENAQRNNIRVFVYVMHGAPGLTERESLEDSLASAKALTDLGVCEMSLSTTFVSPETALLQMYEGGEFKPPNLWSIVHILQTAKEYDWPLRFGGFEETPSPVAIAESCPHCQEDLYAALARHRATGEFGEIPECSCRQAWERDALG